MSSVTKDPSCSVDRRGEYYEERVNNNSKRYPDYHKPSVEVVLAVLHTYDVLETNLARWLATNGISISGFNVLMILNDAGSAGCQLHQLGELLLVSRANITGIVDSLEQRALVERAMDKHDRRVRIARITSTGRELLESLLPSHYRGLRELCSDLTNNEKASLVLLLSKLRKSMQRSTCWRKLREADIPVKEGKVHEKA
jgi:DNA-binding MarR family transcriptional regulator